MEVIKFQRQDGKALKIEIYRTGTSFNRDFKTLDRHRKNFHLIHFVENGSCIHEVDFDSYPLERNQLLFIPKGAIHLERNHHYLKGFYIAFTNDFFSPPQQILLNGLMQYAIVSKKLLVKLTIDQAQHLKTYIELLYKEQDIEDNQNQIFILQNLMLALINKLEGLVQIVEGNNSFVNQRAIFQQFITLLEKNYKTKKSVQFYTQKLNITPRKLSNILKTILGNNTQDIILERVLLEAKRALCYTPRTIKEIAADLGFKNQYYFSRIFKKRLEYSPEEFRKYFAQ